MELVSLKLECFGGLSRVAHKNLGDLLRFSLVESKPCASSHHLAIARIAPRVVVICAKDEGNFVLIQ